MKRPAAPSPALSKASAFLLATACTLAAGPQLFGQTAPTASAAAKPANSATPSNAAVADAAANEDVVVMDPFVVTGEEDTGYTAKATLAGTRIRTELKDVGSAVTAVTAQFLQDTGARNSADLLVYTPSTEVGGQGGNFLGSGTGAVIDTRAARSRPQENTRVRGLTAADNTRDFFLTDIPWDSYIVGRVDLQRGPNSILFGIGSPAGIVNSSINGASFKNSGTVEARYGRFGSLRGTIDLNRVILPDELAVRVDVLNDKTNYRQDPAFAHDRRTFGAVRFDPKFLKSDSARTSLRASYEKGSIDANRPRNTPPIDAITPWFTGMNKATYSARTIALSSQADVYGPDLKYGTADDPKTVGALTTTIDGGIPNVYYQPWIDGGAGGQIFDQPVAVFADPTQNAQQDFFEASQQNQGLDPSITFPWYVYRGIQPYNVFAQRANLPNNGIGAYKAFSLRNPNTFDFYNKLIDGPNKSEDENFDAINVALSQTFFNNKAGVEVAFDKQYHYSEYNQLVPNPFLTIDVMSVLPDGRANPNVGKAMIIGAPNNNGSTESKRETVRVTAFGELDFKELLDNSKLGQALGRHVFTGLYSDYQRDQLNLGWYGYTATNRYRTAYSQTLDSIRTPSVHYLSGNLASATLDTANISNIQARQTIQSGNIWAFNSALKSGVTPPYTASSIVGWERIPLQIRDGRDGADRDALYNNAQKVRDEIESKAAVWQGYLFNGNLVGTVGWREDTADSYNAGSAPQYADQSRRPWDITWKLPDTPATEKGDSLSWSVVAHTPRSIKAKMPLESDISLFYNRSDNFQPAGGRTDVFGNIIGSPSGKTKDYGFTITTLNDRVSLKVNWYETSVNNASLDGGGVGNLSNVYMVGYGEHWGRMFANWAKLNVPDFGNANYALVNPNAPESGSNPRIDPSIGVLRYQPAPGQSVAAAKAAMDLAINTLLANPPPSNFVSHWNIALNQDWSAGWGGYQGPTQPNSLAVTGDTFSKGVEYELSAQPTKNWNIAINMSKTTATRTNLAQSFATWVDERKKLYDGPAGDVRLWGGNFGGETLRSKWTNEFYGSYVLYRQLEGSEVPELRPWRANIITNYNFSEGRFRGANIGGAFRWQDQIVTGFPIVSGMFDIHNPYKGPSEETFDLWVGYGRRIWRGVDWRVQLNVRNVFASDKLIPITVQPDGNMAAARIPEPMVWTLTNTFKF